MKKLLLLSILVSVAFISANAQWVPQATTLPATEKIYSISAVNATVAWAYSNNAVLRTTDGGNTWLTMPFNITASTGGPLVTLHPSSIHALDANTAFVVAIGYAGHANYIRIYKTTDGGLTWTRQSSAYTNDYRVGTISVADFVYFFDHNNGLIFGDRDSGYFEIYTTTNGGQVWSRVPAANLPAATINDLSTPGHLYEAHGDTLWVGVRGMRVLKTTDKGLHWTEANTGIVSSPTNQESLIKDIAFTDASNGLVLYSANATAAPILKRTTDGGLTWNTVNYTGPVGKYDLEAIPGMPGAYITTSGGFSGLGSAITYDNGNTWTSLETTLKHYDIAFLNKHTGWTTSDGMLYKLTNVLNTSEEISQDFGFTLSPNPGNGRFQISNLNAHPFKLEVYGATGTLLLKEKEYALGITSIDLSKRPKGIYLVRIFCNNQLFHKKIVIQ